MTIAGKGFHIGKHCLAYRVPTGWKTDDDDDGRLDAILGAGVHADGHAGTD